MKQTALVTGASGGIGEDLARLIAANGDNVVLVARSAGKLQALADELSRAHTIVASVLTADLSLPGAGEDVANRLAGRGVTVDILVNNAGFGTFNPFVRDDPRQLADMLQVNVAALTMLTRFLLPGMIERRKGRILNVASTAAFQPGPFMAVYYASKAYVLSLSEALAEETEGTGVTVTCLCPGPTRTGFQERAHIQKTRLLSVMSVMTSAEVARAGYDGMMAGRSLVVPGVRNKIGVQSLRFVPRRVATKLVRSLNADA
ncbi:MAG TPA: SDR family oxidoreductase [Vicinamibacterales bacterium]|jgi:short-subunit dehydrogenase